MSNKADRYQYQPWYVKLWRRRHYLPIPFQAARMYLATRKQRRPLSFRNAWSVAIGLAQVRMIWLHDWDELRVRLEKKLGRIGNKEISLVEFEKKDGSNGA